MSNVIQFSITGDTNAEQVAGRAKAAVGGLDKQLDGISKKFGSGFRDIFLSFLGPMALLGTAMAFIGKMIADNQKKHEDANQAAIDGTNKLMSAEDKYWANKRNNEKKGRENVEQAKTSRADITEDFLLNDPRGRAILEKEMDPSGSRPGFLNAFRNKGNEAGILSENERVQKIVQGLIAKDIKDKPITMDGKNSTFASPTGFSNVIGVGANPVLENLTRQTDIQQQILDGLKAMSPSSGGINQPDFTKEVPLSIQKAGL